MTKLENAVLKFMTAIAYKGCLQAQLKKDSVEIVGLIKKDFANELTQKVGTILKPRVVSDKGLEKQIAYCDGRVSAINDVLKVIRELAG